MSSIINTNMSAIRTHNTYNRNNAQMNAAMTRVATGMKINSAKDGASTWAISEKMRERIRANDQANQNVQNDTALLKTAQGGLSNTIDILKTLKERALDAANDSNMNQDRARIATEVAELVKQIDDNAAKVKFNGRTLLNGDYAVDSETTFAPADESSSTASVASEKVAMNKATATNEATSAIYTGATLTAGSFKEYDSKAESASTAPADFSDIGDMTDAKLTNLLASDTSAASNGVVKPSDYIFHVGDKISLSFTLDGKSYTNTLEVTSDTTLGDLLNNTNMNKGLNGNGVKTVWSGTAAALTDSNNDSVYKVSRDGTALTAANATLKNTANQWTIVGQKDSVLTDVSLSISGSGTESNYNKALTALLGSSKKFTSANWVYGDGKSASATASSGGLTFFVGGEANFGLTFGINAMTSEKLGLSDLAEAMRNKGTAETAVGTIDEAINKALNEQTKLGSMEARLGYASDNLVTMNENLEAADSAMRDSDVAKEMTNYMKYSVLAQASQYMLAQAGQNAFSVLNLLST